MDLAYTEFQEMLRQTARDFASRDFPIARHRELVESGRTFDPETWRKMAQTWRKWGGP
jgi:alkylation response protein AidB-like acyl-CoA dehydrogenase